MTQTVLVTGGTGFVAGWCIVRLLQQGYAVRATVRSLARGEAVRQTVARAGVATDALSIVQADLMRDDGWEAAVAGCDYVMHVASPLGGGGEDLQALVGPARDGTIRVLKAATQAGVKRIVVTSSCAAATPDNTQGATESGEEVWTNPDNPAFDAYRKSKAIAERAAWDWMARHDDPNRMATVLPAAVFGPILSKEAMSSVGLIQGMLNGQPPMTPRVGFNVVDVRDLADLHIRAMTHPDAGGQRFIGAGQRVWMSDVAAMLKEGLGAAAAKVPSRQMPDWLVRLLARFVPAMRPLVPMIGRQHSFSGAKAERMLGQTFRTARETIEDCGQSLLTRD